MDIEVVKHTFNSAMIFAPVLAQVLLVFIVYGVLAVRRFEAIKQKTVDADRAPLDKNAWPNKVILATNNLTNQFEAPLLFYVLCFILSAIDGVNPFTLWLSSVYVMLRYLHAYVHLTSNKIEYRFRLFLISHGLLFFMFTLVLLKLWRFL